MKNEKAFTLIELLAVIIVLAIIALIASPIVFKYIGSAQKQALVTSTTNIIKEAQMNCEFEDVCYYVVENGNIYKADDHYAKGDYVTSTGGKDENGKVIVNSDGLGYAAIYNSKWCAYKTNGEQVVSSKEYVEGECDIVTEESPDKESPSE